MTPRMRQLQFNRLVRHFTHRFVDNDLLAGSGEPSQVFVNAMALVCALGFTLTVILAFVFGDMWVYVPTEKWPPYLLADRQLLIILNMIVTGLATVLAWDSMWPDAKDAYAIGTLPVPRMQMMKAKLFAATLYFVLLTLALDLLPGIAIVGVGSVDATTSAVLLDAVVAALVLAASSAFIYFGAMALQGALLLLLPYRLYLKASSALQLVVLLFSLALYSLTPDPVHSLAGKTDWVRWLPPVWFVNAWQHLAGHPLEIPGAPWQWSLAGAALAVVSGTGLLAAGFSTAMRRVVVGESPGRQGPGRLRRATAVLLESTILRNPRERAVFLFTARTVLRHRATRLMIAVYAGLGAAWTLNSFSVLLYRKRMPTVEMDALYCGVPLDLLCCLLVGMRVMYAIPVELKSNWLFRISEKIPAEIYRRGVRKLMLVVGCLPMALAAATAGGAMWDPWRGTRVGLVVFTTGLLITELLMKNFHKLPFTCSWLPGQGNLKARLGAYAILFSALSWMGANFTARASRTPQGTSILLAILAAWIGWLVWQRRNSPPWLCVWEEQQAPTIIQLALSR